MNPVQGVPGPGPAGVQPEAGYSHWQAVSSACTHGRESGGMGLSNGERGAGRARGATRDGSGGRVGVAAPEIQRPGAVANAGTPRDGRGRGGARRGRGRFPLRDGVSGMSGRGRRFHTDGHRLHSGGYRPASSRGPPAGGGVRPGRELRARKGIRRGGAERRGGTGRGRRGGRAE